MVFERVDVAKGCIVDASSWHSVVHQLAHVAATVPHPRKPFLHKPSEVVALTAQPAIDCGVVLRGRWKSKYAVHGGTLVTRRWTRKRRHPLCTWVSPIGATPRALADAPSSPSPAQPAA